MVNQLKFKGILIVISSPSGAGKTSLANSIVEENENIFPSGTDDEKKDDVMKILLTILFKQRIIFTWLN